MRLFNNQITAPYSPREFQQIGFDNLITTSDNVLVSAFVGAGKSHLMLMLAKHYIEQGKRVMVSMHRLTILNQFIEDAQLWGFDYGVCQGNHELTNFKASLQIATVQTLTRRDAASKCDIWLVDEVHYMTDALFKEINDFTGRVISFSATPFHHDLGKLFKRVLNLSNAAELTRLGILAPLRIISGARINIKKLSTDSYGEYSAASVEEGTEEILGDIVDLYKTHALGKRALVFGSRITHAKMMVDALNEAGIPSAVFCADTLPNDRLILIDKFKRGEILVLGTVEALSTGFNVPQAEVMISCRPLRKSFSTFVQALGRVLRAAPSKKEALLIDCDGNIKRFASDFVELFTDGVIALSDFEKKDKEIRQDDDKEDKPQSECPECKSSLWLKGVCMACGYKTPPKPNEIDHIKENIEFKELDIFKVAKKGETNKQLWSELSNYVNQWKDHPNYDKEKALKRCMAMYKQITGSWQKWGQKLTPTKDGGISKEVLGKITQLNIAYAKRKKV